MTKPSSLESVRGRLGSLLGPARYSQYERLIEAFLAGRISRREVEGGLRSLFSQITADVFPQKSKNSLPSYDLCKHVAPGLAPVPERDGEETIGVQTRKSLFSLHNRYVELVLERLAGAETRAIDFVVGERREARGSFGVESSPSANPPPDHEIQSMQTLHVSDILRLLTAADYEAFQKASEVPEASFDSREDLRILAALEDEFHTREQIHRRQQIEHPHAAVSRRVSPILCQVDGILPDVFLVRNVLGAWTRAFNLDHESIEEEHIALLMHAVETYLMQVIRASIESVAAQTSGGSAVSSVVDQQLAIIIDKAAVEAADPFCLS
jgi:hypothetical protein